MELTESKLPVEIKGTWAAARDWHNAAGQFERCKLYCQVMTGFELLALHKEMAVKPGPKGNSSHDGKNSWEEQLNQELGIPTSSAYRYMEMAKASSSRLKKLPGLKGFDPVTTPLLEWTGEQKEALSAGVHKITDGLTQKEFGEQLGLWKVPQGEHGGNHDAKGKRALTAAEQAVRLAERANDSCKAMQALVVDLGPHFCALPDDDLEAHLHFLDTHCRAVRAWLKTPTPQRDPREIAAQIKKEL